MTAPIETSAQALYREHEQLLASENTAPSMGDRHPAALAFHHINNAAQIASMLHQYDEFADGTEAVGETMTTFAARIVELLTLAGENVGALYELFQRQERVIEEQRVETLRERAYATRVEEKNSELNLALIERNERIAKSSRRLEQLYTFASTDAQKSAEFFTAVRQAREALDPAIALPTTASRQSVATGAP